VITILKFYMRWLRQVVFHSYGAVDFWIGILSAAAAVINHWNPGSEFIESLDWRIPLWALGTITVFRIVAAPYWILEADTAKISELSKALNDKEAKDEALKQLWALRRNGVVLRNQQLHDDDEFSSWNKEYKDWRRAVLFHAGVISANLEHRLETLNEVGEPPDIGSPYRGSAHKQAVSVMSEMLRRMERFLEEEL
jgi:hypothetical protein